MDNILFLNHNLQCNIGFHEKVSFFRLSSIFTCPTYCTYETAEYKSSILDLVFYLPTDCCECDGWQVPVSWCWAETLISWLIITCLQLQESPPNDAQSPHRVLLLYWTATQNNMSYLEICFPETKRALKSK